MKVLQKSLSFLTCTAVTAFAVPPPAPDIAAEPLTKIIAELCMKNDPSGKDFARIADATLDLARRHLQTREPTPPSVIESALDAVDAGERKDPKAADWPKLREDLNAFLEKKPEDSQQDKSKQKQQDENQESGEKGDQDEKQSGDQDSDSKDSPDGQKQSEKGEKSGDKDQKQNGENDPSSEQDAPQDGQPQQPDSKKRNSAFGDMKDQPRPQEEAKDPASPDETQTVGGQQNKEAQQKADNQDPQLAIPLQKLEHLRRQDSPAKLFRMMEGEAPVSAKKGKDW